VSSEALVSITSEPIAEFAFCSVGVTGIAAELAWLAAVSGERIRDSAGSRG
jgi:hypothetical protein